MLEQKLWYGKKGCNGITAGLDGVVGYHVGLILH